MKCVVCGERKGKRECPAKNGLICAQCCGEKRVVEIACPADCQHLKSGQSYQSFKKYIAILESQTEPSRRRALFDALTLWEPVVAGIEETIVSFAANLRALRDRDVLEAVETVLKTLETERKGVIFEHRSANPIVQSLVREIHTDLEEARETEVPGAPRPPGLEDLVDCLKAVQAFILFHGESERGNGYLRFAAVNHPEAAARSRGGGLIIP